MMEESTSPLAVFLEYSEEIYLLLEKIQIAILGGIFFVLVFTYSVLNDTFFHTDVFSWSIYFLKLVSFIFVLGYGIPSIRSLNSWGNNFFKSAYILKFEVLPAVGDNFKEQLLNKILEVFIDIDTRLQNYDMSLIKKCFIDVSVRGNKISHLFDVFIGRMRSPEFTKEENEMMKSLEGTKFIAAKEFTQENPVTSEDINAFKEEIFDTIRVPFYLTFLEPDINFNRIILVSNSSFTPDCIEYVKNRKNRIRHTGFDLIEKKGNEYKVIYVN